MDKTTETLTKIRDNYRARGEMVASRAIDYALDRLRADARVRKSKPKPPPKRHLGALGNLMSNLE